MPVVNRFLGIVIAMYWNDHAPAHFATGVVEGRFPKRALRHVWSGTSYIETNSWTTGKGAAGKRLRIPSTRWSESMFLHVTNAKPLDGYRVEVCFDDGREGIADLTEALEGPMFEPLKDREVFTKFRVDEELQTIVWPNGADLAPEYIYYQTFREDPELQVTFRKWGYIV